VTISAKFPPLVGDFLAMILMGSDRRNKKESIGIFFVFLAFFQACGKFLGYKTLKSLFLRILPVRIDEGDQQQPMYAVVYQFRNFSESQKISQ
jgi:hypothetical protein